MQHVLLQNDLARLQKLLEPEALHLIQDAQLEGYSNFGDFALLSFEWYDIVSDTEELFRILIYLSRDNLCFICNADNARRYCEDAVSAITAALPELSSEQLLYRFFIQLFRGDMDHLERFEDRLDATMNAILAGKLDSALDTIVRERRELVRLKRYYEQLGVVFDDILLDDDPLFSEKILNRLSILDSRIDRYAGKVQNLQAIVSQMQDTYQAQLSIQQNDLMKVFTIVTAIFLPLTLLAGWYGMNFADMPELHWRYGYPAVAGVSLAIVLGLVWFFKRKKWL